mmetsp:Transcript_8619/g.25766  ORF Transcript_8619/g.25766 Transcript_8619/m.25766 type:complete len:425 (+) Transcript_8619:824-2098(+)
MVFWRRDPMDDVYPLMLKACWSCGTFSIAFAWAIVFFAALHAAHGQSVLDQQIGMPHGVDGFLTLLAIYLGACLFSGLASIRLRAIQSRRYFHIVLAESIDFFPSPIFSGCLMAYLTTFHAGGKLGNALRDFLASWVVAAAIVAAPAMAARLPEGDLRYYGAVIVRTMSMTVSFGLGIAWDSTISGGLELILPRNGGLVTHSVYLFIVAAIAARLAAEPTPSSAVGKSQLDLLAFASKVVAAFALVAWLTVAMSLLGEEGITNQVCVILLLVPVNAFLSGAISKVDLSPLPPGSAAARTRENCGDMARIAMFIPCFWCCCPWLIVLALVVDNVEPQVVKSKWLEMSSFVTGLAASIAASGLVVYVIDATASAVGVDSTPGQFVLVAAGVASFLTGLVAFLIEPLAAAEAQFPIATPVVANASLV